MKTNKAQSNSIHQRVERFFRHRACLAAMLGFMFIALLKTDGRLVSMMREMYAQGFGLVGTYMREEPTRPPVDLGTNVRVVTISGR